VPVRYCAYVKRIHFVYTPKHGSWLNVAECELSAKTRLCLNGRRIGELDELQDGIALPGPTTSTKNNAEWQLQLDEARTKLARLSTPKIKTGWCSRLVHVENGSVERVLGEIMLARCAKLNGII
jgi:hypothetical protein